MKPELNSSSNIATHRRSFLWQKSQVSLTSKFFSHKKDPSLGLLLSARQKWRLMAVSTGHLQYPQFSPNRSWSMKKICSEISKSTLDPTRPRGGLTLLGMLCSVGTFWNWYALKKKNHAHSQRGHSLSSEESRLISAAATRGLFTATNKKRHHFCSSGLLGSHLPRACPQSMLSSHHSCQSFCCDLFISPETPH